ncbi:phage portal protein family protein, partial [Serratia fonticola]|uniref:phage portal protein family protein n=1 Tax=Serratia fonticola TaxID=47917 RepID=UPI0013785964
GPATWLTELNFPGAAVPQVSRVFDEPEDLKSRAERDKSISETTGYRPTLAYVKDTYGGDWEPKPNSDTPPVAPVTPVAPAGNKPSDFAEHSHPQDAPAAMAIRLNSELTPVTDGWMQQLQELVDSVDSLEALRDGLDKLVPDMTLDQYAEVLAQAMSAAALAGRYELLEAVNGR